MNKKSGSASGRDNNNEKGYQRKEDGGTAKPFGRSKYAGGDSNPFKRASTKDDKPYNKDGADKVRPAFKKDSDGHKPADDSDNPWKRPSKSGDRKKSAPRAESDNAAPGSDEHNPWKREKKGGRSKSFDKKDGDSSFADQKPREDGDNPWKRESKGGDRKKPFEKRDGDAPYADRKPRTDSDNAWKRTEKTDRKKPFVKGDADYTGKEAENKWERSNEDGKKPFPKRDRAEKRPFPKKDGDAPYGAKKPFPKRDGDAPYGAKKPFAKKDGDAPYARKPRPDGDAEGTWKKKDGDGEKKPYAKKDSSEGSLWQKGIDYSDRGMPKKTGEKRAIKDSDKPFFQRDAAKGVEPKFDAPEDMPYESFEISDELLEEKKKNRKVAVKKEDPARAFKKETNEPISSRYGDKPAKKDAGDKKPKNKIEKADEKRPFKKAPGEGKKPFDRKDRHPEVEAGEDDEDDEPIRKKKRRHHHDEDEEEEEVKGPEAMPLNKYLAHSGVCSRRDAAILVKEGKVKINGEVITNPGHKVGDEDVVYFNDKKLTIQKGMVYILLNKPKDYITTNDDPQGRKTVMQLVATAEGERLFPVGRLDRNTSGLLLITNDGDLTQKLAHPSNRVKKIYQVTLDKPVTKADFEKIINGLDLEDGKAHVDALSYLETKSELGIEIHIGRNRIVRRIFESLGYVVEKLDRVMYANLTKKNLPRGKWRYLNEREIVLLKHFKS